MPSLGELKDSEARLAHRPARSSPVHGRMPWRDVMVGEETISFARVQVRGLGFETPPTWGSVMRRVARTARLCTPEMHSGLRHVAEGLADHFRMVMKPIKGSERIVFICTGDTEHGPVEVSVAPPNQRLSLDAEIVYPLRTH